MENMDNLQQAEKCTQMEVIDETGDLKQSKQIKFKPPTLMGVRDTNVNQRGINTGDRQADPNQQYIQQYVQGRPVYVQGPQPPLNAARQPLASRYEEPQQTYDEEVFTNSFNTREIRHRFIKKVYLLLTCLLGFTAVIIGIFVYEPHARKFGRKNLMFGFGALLAAMVIYMVLVCVQSARKNFPLNIILLLIYTMLSAFAYGMIATMYVPNVVLYSAATTAGVCLLITLLACQKWVDITGWGMYLCIAGIVVSLIGLIIMILSFIMGLGVLVHLIYAGIVALLVSFYFMFTTQLIMGGKKIQLSPEEYIFGTIVLYAEIMLLFSSMLTIFGGLCR